jgi:hypothetical protein
MTLMTTTITSLVTSARLLRQWITCCNRLSLPPRLRQ